MHQHTVTPRRKACVECRQQKIRCDVEQHKTPHDACSRCRKMSLECRILPTSTRNLRQTKAEMRRELEELKWSYRHDSNDPNHPHSAPSSNVGADVRHFSPLEPGSGGLSHASPPTDGSTSSPAFENGQSQPSTRKSSAPAMTQLRSLDGFVVEARKIDDCFQLFFTQCHPLCPILDIRLNANEYYELSPFLFWTIVVTGARRYPDDPGILDKISQSINALAFSSMALRSTPIPIIQGLLILCTWRLPTRSMYKDMTYVLSGAATHLATQIGLHVSGVGQDFARTPLKKDLDQTMFRARLWMHCVIVSIRQAPPSAVTSCTEGIPPLVIGESFFDGNRRERDDMYAYLPPELQFQHQVHMLLYRAIAAVGRTTNLKSVNCDVNVLRSVISSFDLQLLNLNASSPSELDTFQLSCARIHVLAFHFFAHPTEPEPDSEGLIRLFWLCVSTIQTTNNMVQQMKLATICLSFIDRTLTLAAFCLLKLHRSPLAQHLDLAAGEQAYFTAVHLSKIMSLQDNDLRARTAGIMTNLWSSAKVFRSRDGTIDSLGLRLRTRLSMSISFDMFWYWREEFGNMPNPYDDENAPVESQPTTPRKCLHPPVYYEKEVQEVPVPVGVAPAPIPKFPPVPVAQIQPNPMVGTSFESPWDTSSEYAVPPVMDQPFPDYDWAASFDYPNDWATVPLVPLGGNVGGFNGPL
ncbi:hypothetical protein BDV95DRAFT_502468 [Massariosphaeria phaeospora]|uniref:Zn(2)-C6 fungal-type domain-containing protein n=1 Tax=Massariosphaeria phaeospora TaxID=100035 RepID=A0A7C8M9T3_9PLEO|nr:hypothetical protein BDV95DRAFT_502468 [Massariosphaeria phaeospora]